LPICSGFIGGMPCMTMSPGFMPDLQGPSHLPSIFMFISETPDIGGSKVIFMSPVYSVSRDMVYSPSMVLLTPLLSQLLRTR
jgi:hypothetical protein